METILNYLLVFAIFYPVTLFYIYLIPAGVFYYLFYLRNTDYERVTRIQNKKPTKESIKREIVNSMISVAFYTIMTILLYEAWKLGYTKVYLDFSEHSLSYTIASLFIIIALHDTYFYWTHRFMHWPPVFKYFHRTHHLSVTPTPWAIYSFQPMEMFVQFGIHLLVIFFVPAHPVVLVLWLTYNNIVNAGGHCGHEFFPDRMKNHWFFKWNNCVEHHDLHHSRFNCNYGLNFNFWDRWMGTHELG